MAKKAVLVGCNYPDSKAELRGCVNDVNRVHKTLIDRYGFDKSDITILIDTDSSLMQPTGENIKRALNKLVEESESGDVLFFHYSGHGFRLPAEADADDNTGYDECIVPCDMNLITDDDFREIVDKVPDGVILTLISDSCHSGGLINNAKEQIGESSLQRDNVPSIETKGGGLGVRVRSYLTEKIHGALKNRGIDFSIFGHTLHSHRRYHHTRDLDEYYQQVRYVGDGDVRSRSLPVSTLIDILKQKTGNDDLDVGIIRPTLFDMFGRDSSSKVKKFVKILLQSVHRDHSDGDGSVPHLGRSSSLAQKFIEHKLDESEDANEYFKPALEMPVSNCGEAYAGTVGGSTAYKDRGVLVSGCQTDETSADANLSGDKAEAYGAMSNALQMVLAENKGPITNYELVMELRKVLKKQGFSQRPGLYCADHNVNATFIC
ncbi:hypothetical protein KP509_04G039500 [Ceratopteris richardii]|uniref:Peptidase C14 caspase domain-containing protein n=1 Tax=Ceratopteris richardii TaxID=49495 RepID=A0A8T2UZR9_CERRI|nr:hypothetical protein KP509_04G039500 [Ceratopteris richardii]